MMKPALIFVFALLLSAPAARPAIRYFTRTRVVKVSAPDRQNYFPVDSDIWEFSRPDLADLRIYDGDDQVPYVLVKQSGGSATQEREAKIINLGTIDKSTEFDLETGGLEQYNRVRLQIEAKNFINAALVQGRLHLNDNSLARLGRSTLYDFTHEGLGSNFVLKFPTASFPYLHVRLAPGIQPSQIKGAYISSFVESKVAWMPAGTCSPVSGTAKRSVFKCNISEHMPVERVQFALPAEAVNFNRVVILSDAQGNELQRGVISRVRLNRGGQNVVSDELSIDVYPQSVKAIQVAIENGDDKPLPVQQITPLAFERRICFNPHGKSAVQLYYGDAKLSAPIYDYAKLFQVAPNAAIAQLGPGSSNPEFTGHPDDRPWSERHSMVLWGAMLLAIAILGGLTLRGLKKNSASP
jgi:Protein of unknown function (DUF3999)